MKIQTSRFGMLDVSDDTLLTFPCGLIGFPAFRRFVVLDPPEDADYQWFQSVDEPSLAFVTMNVHLLQPDFRTRLSEEGLAELDMTSTDSISIMVLVTIPSEQPDQATVNLRAPLVVNERTRHGKQLILHESIPLRYPLFQDSTQCQTYSGVATEAASV
ncbi:MAG: flagellar assembly factor FliW [Nitrospirales bacterium]|nr:MAG: flagellar assembly factor FliW [Nitrospirales bacterium]